MDYHKHIIRLHPGNRWDSGSYESILFVKTDLATPEKPDHDKKKFAELEKWVQTYRDKRYPNFKIEYRN